MGRLALDVPSVKLEQFQQDHRLHVEPAFAKATAAHLHCLLCQGDWALPPENIDVLLELTEAAACVSWKNTERLDYFVEFSHLVWYLRAKGQVDDSLSTSSFFEQVQLFFR